MVVCPLAFEAGVLRREGLDRHVEIQVCGPGASGVNRWAAAHAPTRPVILCGLAGSLSRSCEIGTAHVPSAVIDRDGLRHEPSLGIPPPEGPVISSADHTLTTPPAKRDFADRAEADLVDLESTAFARAAARGAWHWTIVRGISDGPETTLPADVDGWVTAQGDTRPGKVLQAVLRGRASIGQLRRLRADGMTAMRAAARLVERIVRDEVS